jgi:hypothetical protein
MKRKLRDEEMIAEKEREIAEKKRKADELLQMLRMSCKKSLIKD